MATKKRTRDAAVAVPPDLSRVRAEAGRRGGAARATGGAGKRWPVQLPLDRADRQRVIAAARAAGVPVGEWLATLARRAL